MTKNEDHPHSGLPIDKIELLSQPLVTDDGFLNPACMAELEAAIRKMPEAHERLAGEPEWTRPAWTTLCELLGAFTGNATRAFRRYPPKLDAVVGFLEAALRPMFREFDGIHMAEVSLCDINRMLWEVLGDLETFKDWNREDVMGKDWIDLSALLQQTCISIRNERRHSYAFDHEFHKRHGCSPTHGGMGEP